MKRIPSGRPELGGSTGLPAPQQQLRSSRVTPEFQKLPPGPRDASSYSPIRIGDDLVGSSPEIRPIVEEEAPAVMTKLRNHVGVGDSVQIIPAGETVNNTGTTSGSGNLLIAGGPRTPSGFEPGGPGMLEEGFFRSNAHIGIAPDPLRLGPPGGGA